MMMCKDGPPRDHYDGNNNKMNKMALFETCKNHSRKRWKTNEDLDQTETNLRIELILIYNEEIPILFDDIWMESITTHGTNRSQRNTQQNSDDSFDDETSQHTVQIRMKRRDV
eukprot:78326_1